jgi:hypothetical protein
MRRLSSMIAPGMLNVVSRKRGTRVHFQRGRLFARGAADQPRGMGPLIPVLLFVLLLLAGGLVAGSLYAAVLIPIAIVILIGSIVLSVWRKSQAGPEKPKAQHPIDPVSGQPDSGGQVYGHGSGAGTATASPPSTPDDLVAARQRNQ